MVKKGLFNMFNNLRRNMVRTGGSGGTSARVPTFFNDINAGRAVQAKPLFLNFSIEKKIHKAFYEIL